jgi:hypothetical protein
VTGQQPEQGGGFFNSVWNFGPGGAVTQLQEQLSAPTGQQGQGAERPAATTGFRAAWSREQPVREAAATVDPATGQPPVITSTTGAGTVANLRSDAEFTSLVQGISEFGDMSAPQQQAVAQAIASRYGLTMGTVLQMAQQELLGTRENPTPAPGYRPPWGSR